MKLHPLVGVIVGALLASVVWFFAYQANANQLKQTTAIRISSSFK
jgi:ABC-type enterochelin transport system permease subunit